MASDLFRQMEKTLLLLDRLHEFVGKGDEELQKSATNVRNRIETSKRIIGELESAIAGHQSYLQQSEFEARLIEVALAVKHPDRVSAELAEFVKALYEVLKINPEFLQTQITI